VIVMNADMPSVMIVRARRGVVRESKRVCHIVPIPDTPDDAVPDFLTSYCGTRLLAGQNELVHGPMGMPCLECLVTAPIPGLHELEAHVVRD
jgi:hypothetical protein